MIGPQAKTAAHCDTPCGISRHESTHMKSLLKWIRQVRLPKWTDIREALCLFTLSAAMIFSVLNIGVHRLTEKLWTPISIGLSPDGKEYYSIS